jgi:predicted alpha/beta superfamily hydrolase
MSFVSTKYSGKKMLFFKTPFLILLLLFTCFYAFPQFSIHMIIRSSPSTHNGDTIFVAGSFNNWNPGNEKYKFTKINGIIKIDITGLQKNSYPFKFTRGSWQKTEVSANGKGIENRIIQLESDTTIEYSIAGWEDDFSITPKQHTASSNVQVLDTAFFIPQLNRTRRIWIYLPSDYVTGKKKYPVLYMQDGQNLFDEYTAPYGEWGVDECLDSVIRKNKPACIVVGIDNSPYRLNEYNPYENPEYGKGEGEEYTRFLVESLKPYIDKHYRTIASKENTIIAGSSFGGLISYYAMLRYPDTFGKGGMFSPSFWIAPKINDLTDSLGSKLKGQFFFFAGELEGGSMIPDIKIITDKLGANSGTLIYSVTDPEGKHNETTWRKWFEEFYLWIMGNGLSYQIKAGN